MQTDAVLSWQTDAVNLGSNSLTPGHKPISMQNICSETQHKKPEHPNLFAYPKLSPYHVLVIQRNRLHCESAWDKHQKSPCFWHLQTNTLTKWSQFCTDSWSLHSASLASTGALPNTLSETISHSQNDGLADFSSLFQRCDFMNCALWFLIWCYKRWTW